jgi:uncharacterized membrane protein
MHIVNHAKYGIRKYDLKMHLFGFVIVINIFDIVVIIITIIIISIIVIIMNDTK